jgi:hypothetical protein
MIGLKINSIQNCISSNYKLFSPTILNKKRNKNKKNTTKYFLYGKIIKLKPDLKPALKLGTSEQQYLQTLLPF